MCKMQITVARATQLCRRNVGTMGKFQCTQFSLLSGQTKNPLAIVVWMPRVTDQRWKIQGDVLHGILPKNALPTRVTHFSFIVLQKFYSDHYLKYFCEFPNNISFLFLLQKNKPTHVQSATIVLTLWIYCTEDKQQSCILIWRNSKKRCVHCN